MRSFRFALALRFTLAMALAAGVVSVASVLALRALLDRELRESILNVASIQASSVVDSPDGDMHFHEWELTPDEAVSVRDLVRYGQVWDVRGSSLLRSRFLERDLPLDREALVAAREGEPVWRRQDLDGVPILSLYYGLGRFGAAHRGHVLQVAAPLSARQEMVRRLALLFGAVTALVTLLSFAGSWWLAGRTIRPVHEVIDQAAAIEAGSLDRRIEAYAETREYRRMVEVLNTMLHRIHRAFQAQTRFTADASHELRSPLTALRGEIEIALRKERTAGEYRAVLESAQEEILRLSRTTEGLLTLARADAGALESGTWEMDPDEVAGRILERFQRAAEAKSIELSYEVGGAGVVPLDPGLTGQVLWNLVDNAVRYTPRGGRVAVGVRRAPDALILEVRDTGPGPGDDPERLFERFFRRDQARTPGGEAAGTGLGLAIVRAIVDAMGGDVRAEAVPGGGARFTARLPFDGAGSGARRPG